MKSQLHLLIRKNQQRRIIPVVKTGIESVLNLTLSDKDFVDIEKTDLIVDRFSQSFQEHGRFNSVLFMEKDDRKLNEIMQRIAEKYSNQSGYLLLTRARECGVIRVNIEFPIRLWKELITFDGDSFSIVNLEMNEAIHLDYFEDYINEESQFFYELTVWKML